MQSESTSPAPRDVAFVLHDDPATVALVRAVLGPCGFDVSAADTPFEAMSGAPGAEPALALVGMTAVEVRDLEVVRFLRRRWPRTTLVAMFPASLRERAARALSFGADGYLPEPFYASELADLARGAARRAGGPRRETGAADPAAATLSAASPAPPATAASAADDSLSKLAAGVAHTIRNPLQILELQISGYEADGEADAAGMREQLRRIAGVVESLTRFSARRKLDTRIVDVNALVQRVFAAAPGAAAAPRVEVSPERLEVLGAPELLRAALQSVRARAERVTRKSGDMRVRTALVTSASGRREVEIAVTDQGPAPTAAQIASFFDPFPDADHVVDGSGLEMAALLGIVRHHGGAASAATDAAGGTTVTLRLPARGTPGAGSSTGEAS